jgi:predicted nucleotidyltransferase
MNDSQSIKNSLKALLQKQDNILAAWEGGSVATGYADRYSDLDLSIVSKDKDTNPVFALLEEHFTAEYGIERQFRMPEPAWHGMSQCFYMLKDTQDFFYCDIVVMPEDAQDKFTAWDRHGRAHVWFDKEGIFSSEATPPEEIRELCVKMFKAATATDFLSILELKKALARGNWIHSHLNYMIFLNRHLVPLLNLKYRPAKADFGIRYTDRDYPATVAKKLEELLRINDIDSVRIKSVDALNWFAELKSELALGFPS